MSVIESQPSESPEQSAKLDPVSQPEQKDIDDSMDEEAMIANAMSGDKIKELLSAEGPTVKSVLLKTDGSIQEILYDSTPSKNHVSEILCAPPSIIGQYPDLDVIIVGPRSQEDAPEFELNTHKLRYPFNNDTFHGDIFLYRFDQDCVMQDFTVKEYETFAAKAHEDVGKVFKPIISDEQDTYSEDEQDDEEQIQVTQDFMREIIVNKVKAEFPAKFGREPTEEELESYIASIMGVAGGLFAVEEESDGDYDPNDDAEADGEEIPNEEQLEQDKKDIESDQHIEQQPLKEMDQNDEEELVNSEAFEAELLSAMECVQHMAKIDREKILALARQEYTNDVGQAPTDDMMAEALQMFAVEEETEANGVETEPNAEDKETEPVADVDPELFAKEMQEALGVVRNLGKEHQKELVDKICNTYSELNGSEPTQEQLKDIFGRIQEDLADEAKDEFLECNDAQDDVEDDPTYKPNDEDMQQVQDDKKEEVLNELMEEKADEAEVERKKSVTVLVTPVKRKASGSRMGIYLDEQNTQKTLEVAASRFEQINHRAPTDDDSQRLKEFCDTGMLFESVIKADAEFDNDSDDEEYDPAKDTFDYSQDIEDDIALEKEATELNENEDTSNMIDID
eukprot:471678_1